MLMKISDEPIAAIRIAASVEPITVPVPPRMLTPPTTEAVMMVSSRFGGTVDWMIASCVAKRIAAMPTKKPWMAKTFTIVALAADAGEPRRFGVAADGVDRAAGRREAHPERRARWSGPP